MTLYNQNGLRFCFLMVVPCRNDRVTLALLAVVMLVIVYTVINKKISLHNVNADSSKTAENHKTVVIPTITSP